MNFMDLIKSRKLKNYLEHNFDFHQIDWPYHYQTHHQIHLD